jgi:hypothetical protein
MKERFVRAYRGLFPGSSNRDANKAWWKYEKNNGRWDIILAYEKHSAWIMDQD